MKPRPTILGLMGLIAIIALGLAAIRANDAIWTAVVLTLTVFALCVASVVAIYDRGGAWAGFAIFGWAAFLICQPHSAPTMGPTSVATEIACRLYNDRNTPTSLPNSITPGHPAIGADPDGRPMIVLTSGGGGFFGLQVPLEIMRVGLCLWTMLFAAIGALVGTIITWRRPSPGAS